MSRTALLAACLFFALPSSVTATSFAPRRLAPIEQRIDDVVARGVLITGHVIRPFDVKKKQPEIIHAEAIFVGSAHGPRDFAIYHSPKEYEHSPLLFTPAGAEQVPLSPDQDYEYLILMPAPVGEDGSGKGQWIVDYDMNDLREGKGRELLLAKAAEAGRLHARPCPDWFIPATREEVKRKTRPGELRLVRKVSC